MKKIVSLLLVLVLSVGMFAACGGNSSSSTAEPAKDSADSTAESTVSTVAEDSKPAEGRELNLYTWAGMFPDNVLRDFTDQTGIKINYSNFDYNETMLSKLQVDKGGGYDLVIGDDYILQTIIEEGLAQKLDTSKLSNYGNINPTFQSQYYDPTNEYIVPYGSGVQTIVYNPADPALEGLVVKGYADLWNPAFADKLGIIGNYRVINGMALKVMGESYNTEDVAKINAAGEKLAELAPNIRLIKDDNLQDDLISGEISGAVMYTSQVTLAMRSNPELKVVFPEEGIGFGIMGQFIPANAPNPDSAYEFINYILDAKIAAECFEEFGYYTTNKASEEFISEESKEFLILPEGLSEKMEIIEPVGLEATDAHSAVWTKFMSAK